MSSPVPMCALGSQGLQASAMGYGAMGLTAFYGAPCADDDGVRLLKRVHELGVNLIDTAEIYRGKGEDGVMKANEALVGKAAAEIGRDNLVICTKHIPGGWQAMFQNISGGNEGMPEVNSGNLRSIIREACHNSLKELGIDCIDLYYLHRMYAAPITIEEVMQVFKELKDEGKIKYVGLSEAPASYIRRAHAVTPISAVQQEWSLIARDLEETGGIVDTCRELGIGIVAYSPVARGFLSGQHLDKAPSDWRALIPYMTDDTREDNASLVREISEMASARGLTVGQLTLAWVCSRGVDVFPIPGTTKLEHLKQNVAAATVQLTEEEIKKMEELAKRMKGERGSERYLKESYHGHK